MVAVEAKRVGHELADHSLCRAALPDLLSIPANATGLYSAPPWDADREPSVRWKADRQRKKKARGAKKAADAGTARKTKR